MTNGDLLSWLGNCHRCGIQVEIIRESQVIAKATVGGLIKVGNEVYGLTVGHLFSPSATHDDEVYQRLSTWQEWEGCDMELDWALVKMPGLQEQDVDSWMDVNLVRTVSGVFRPVLTALEEPSPYTQVVVATPGSTHCLRGVFIGTGAIVNIPESPTPIATWVCRMELPWLIRPGDSGSWVFDAENGMLLGVLVAGCPEVQEAYIIPAHGIFDDITQHYSKYPGVRGPEEPEVTGTTGTTTMAEITVSSHYNLDYMFGNPSRELRLAHYNLLNNMFVTHENQYGTSEYSWGLDSSTKMDMRTTDWPPWDRVTAREVLDRLSEDLQTMIIFHRGGIQISLPETKISNSPFVSPTLTPGSDMMLLAVKILKKDKRFLVIHPPPSIGPSTFTQNCLSAKYPPDIDIGCFKQRQKLDLPHEHSRFYLQEFDQFVDVVIYEGSIEHESSYSQHGPTGWIMKGAQQGMERDHLSPPFSAILHLPRRG
ncbi:hypothetical protein FAUST_4221 [Fusarium austroamericanum]|uniref:Peptidase S1 domain-containing protein n=1 Tax=Fusarium austroamericanum TaxID=282268 RepID=A0AAN6HH28_FUSAU|nr:hypothetical protein FAUST_4221 [Fusarium austroamericanum]